MKKLVLTLIGFTITSLLLAQKLEIGLRVSPNLSINRIVDYPEDDDDLIKTDIETDENKLRFTAGIIADLYLMKNIALTSGILYSPKQAGLNAEVTKPDTSFTINYKVNLQYIQIPVGFKFFTNPVTDKIKIYAELSGMLDLKINEKPVVRNEYFTRTFAALWDAGINVGAGIEWQINDNNKLVAGLLWNRGFNNIIQKDFIKEHGITKRNLEFRNDLVNLVLAFKF